MSIARLCAKKLPSAVNLVFHGREPLAVVKLLAFNALGHRAERPCGALLRVKRFLRFLAQLVSGDEFVHMVYPFCGRVFRAADLLTPKG